MKINKLIMGDFGKLSDVSISLDDRVTVITGKNEAGKSSVAAFIKYMLYGFSGTRSSDLSENQKKKYMPWDKDAVFGEMLFSDKNGNRYRAVRRSSAKNQSGVFDEDGQPTEILCAGEHFLGVDEACFKKTAYIAESDPCFSDSGELDEAIRNIVYSADEGVDSAKAIKKLDALRKHYLAKNGKSGEIFQLNEEISELEANRDKWQSGHKALMSAEYNLSQIGEKIAFNASKKKMLEQELENLTYAKAKKVLEEMEKHRSNVEEGKKALEEHFASMKCEESVPDESVLQVLESLVSRYDVTAKQYADAQRDVEKAKQGLESLYSDASQRSVSMGLEKMNLTAAEMLEKLSELDNKARKLKLLGIILCVLVVTLPLGLFFVLKFKGIKKKIEAIVSDFQCEDENQLKKRLESISSFRHLEKSARDIMKNAVDKSVSASDEMENILRTLMSQGEKWGFYKATDDGLQNESGEIVVQNAKEYIPRLEKQLHKLEELKRNCQTHFAAYSALASNNNEEEMRILASKYDESITVRDEALIRRDIAFYTQANEALTVKERELEKTAAVLSGTLPKPAEIQSRINSLTAQKQELVIKHAGLEMAIEALEKACENIKKQASPLITADLGEMFSAITDGKYSTLYTDSGMNLSFGDTVTNLPRESGYLSTGTRDAAYISLRLALCKYLYKESPVLIFDDAFSRLDDERLKSVLELLWKLSEEFQIVILSCHTREKEFFEGKGKIIEFVTQ